VIDFRRERFEDEVEKVDLVFDLIGGETQARSFQVLRRGGAMISTLEEPDREKAAAAGVRVGRFTAQPNGEQLAQISRLIDSGRVTPEIHRTYPLERAGDAEAFLAHGHVRGKVVLTTH
jgi:NADPH:quinone reductase-like Zn-dependent oxidoreductase